MHQLTALCRPASKGSLRVFDTRTLELSAEPVPGAHRPPQRMRSLAASRSYDPLNAVATSSTSWDWEELRASASRRPKEVLAAEPIPYESGSGTDDEVDDRLVVSDAVAKLSEADQELVRLRYYEDLTCAMLAERFGLSEATVKVRLHRLRRRLRQGLEERS